MARSIYWAGRVMMTAVLVLAVAARVAAQIPGNPYDPTLPTQPGGVGCTPYVPPGCLGVPLTPLANPTTEPSLFEFTAAFDFPEVQVGQAGFDNDFMAFVPLTNKTAQDNKVTVTVTWEGSPSVTRTFTLGSKARMSVKLNEWPELQGFVGALTVEVRMRFTGASGLVMRSERDPWRTFTILDGR